jgi:hypothetical protein
MTSTALTYVGLAIWSGWTALFTFDGSTMLTLLLRLAASMVIAVVVFGALFGLRKESLEWLFGLYALFFCVPVVALSFAFGALKEAIGWVPYLALLAVSTAMFAVSFMIEAGVING